MKKKIFFEKFRFFNFFTLLTLLHVNMFHPNKEKVYKKTDIFSYITISIQKKSNIIWKFSKIFKKQNQIFNSLQTQFSKFEILKFVHIFTFSYQLLFDGISNANAYAPAVFFLLLHVIFWKYFEIDFYNNIFFNKISPSFFKEANWTKIRI